jgi:hypothetical protein
MTSIWYEILPVTLESDQVVVLRRREDGEAQPWQVFHQAGRHPNATVLEHVAHCFGELFEPEGLIVHSTSWRYCDRSDRLILTYLVVLPQRTWRGCRTGSHRLVAYPVGQVEPARGDHLQPPEHIEMNHILAHALDHLALLRSSDASISAVLESGWLHVLELRLPKPAGYVAHPGRE